jgi:hypothetical protein
MVDQVQIHFPQTVVPEETTFTATVYFRTRATATASTPTTIHYRIDCIASGRQVVDWTSVSSPSTSNTITISATHNQILSDLHLREKKQLTIKVDSGLSTQIIAKKTWYVENLLGIR